ncbi:MAG: alpha/beta hydrolase [Chloroflexota bacterium]
MPTIKAGDINLEYSTEGSGPPLLLIMGFGGSLKDWGEPFLENLRKHFTVTRFSNRGTGRSDPAIQPFTIRTMADDASNLIDALGLGRPHVLGISMGGMIAQELVLNYPEKVNGLVLGCTTCGPAHGVVAKPETMALLAPAQGASPEDIIRKFWGALVSPAYEKSAGGLAFLEAMMREQLTVPTPMQTLGLQISAIMQHDTFDRLPQIKAPTLIIHGDVDKLVPPENADILQKQLSGSDQKWIKGAAHMFFWEQPAIAESHITQHLSRVPAAA